MKINQKHVSITLISLFLILSVADIYREYSSGETLQHLAFEIVVCLCGSLWSIYLCYNWLTTKTKLHKEIAEKTRIFADMNKVIMDQFSAWDLTPSEKDVAYLLLKGLPFKEIADLRGNSEKTIRQHAMKVYQKSGLQGRTDLFAYFFEDLFSSQNRP